MGQQSYEAHISFSNLDTDDYRTRPIRAASEDGNINKQYMAFHADTNLKWYDNTKGRDESEEYVHCGARVLGSGEYGEGQRTGAAHLNSLKPDKSCYDCIHM